MADLFSQYFMQQQINDIGRDMQEVAHEANASAREVSELRGAVDRLTLACQALWALLGERIGMADSELLEKIREIDLSDGVLDGRVRKAKSCPNCGRQNGGRRIRCLYCAQSLSETAFS
jgi:hypothetical protein